MHLLLALALLLSPALPLGTVPPPFPWATYEAIPATGTAPACHGRAHVVQINEEWSALSSDTRDVFLHATAGVPDYVYFSDGTVGTGPHIVRVLPLAEAERLYPDPCAYLDELTT